MNASESYPLLAAIAALAADWPLVFEVRRALAELDELRATAAEDWPPPWEPAAEICDRAAQLLRSAQCWVGAGAVERETAERVAANDLERAAGELRAAAGALDAAGAKLARTLGDLLEISCAIHDLIPERTR